LYNFFKIVPSQKKGRSGEMPHYFCPAEKMGRIVGNKEVLLSEEFLKTRLGTSQRDAMDGEIINRTKHIYCPFCRVGLLELVKIDPSRLSTPGSEDQHSLSIRYEYVCINTHCQAKFSGTCSWK